jgi:predicted nucleic acid-binding Zn ribbon protein
MEPQNSKKMCGRSEFFIHGCGVCSKGDSTEPPVGGCSEGCIIMNHENRKKLRVGDIINVVAKDPKTQRYPRLPQLAMP